jgi:UDP-3-O-[3-hydroxymyristoyl] N-acetylglucosamine deacetylase
MRYAQRTLEKPAHFEGRGLHSGVPVKMTVHPHDEGIVFRCGREEVRALPENVTDTTRHTRLGGIGTVEHLMSAFAGLEVTDALVELDAPELPGLDGSARPFVEGLVEAGFASGGERELPELFARVFLHEGPVRVAIARGDGHWRYEFSSGARWPGSQISEHLDVVERFPVEIAPARTFAFAEEVPALLQAGLGAGLDEKSALILDSTDYRGGSRFPDEPARHKLLDLIGDLYLSGVPLRALNVVAEQSGHRWNVEAAARLRQTLLDPTWAETTSQA